MYRTFGCSEQIYVYTYWSQTTEDKETKNKHEERKEPARLYGLDLEVQRDERENKALFKKSESLGILGSQKNK